jgi:hypothetical protein
VDVDLRLLNFPQDVRFAISFHFDTPYHRLIGSLFPTLENPKMFASRHLVAGGVD